MILSVNGLSFAYPSRSVLQQVSFTIEEKDCVAILGTNGAGKSTLLKCLARTLKPQDGCIAIDGKEISALSNIQSAQKVGYVAQQQSRLRQTVYDAVLLGRKPYIKWDAGEHDLAVVSETLAAFGLADMALRYTDELSGGELQKVIIARAVAQQPRILLLDEPTSNLDLKNQFEAIGIIRQVMETRRLSVLVTMHDVNLALRFANKFLLLKDGTIYAAGGREVITAKHIQAVYAVQAAIHQLDGLTVVVPQAHTPS